MRDNIIPCHHTVSEDTVYKEVVVIGNGPSGLVTSFMLAGNVPYIKKPIPEDLPIDDMLRARLSNIPEGQSLYDVNLAELAEGLEGRSHNPIPLLMDTLLRPCTDMGIQAESLIEWRFDVDKQVDHVVLGRGQPGGSWHTFPPALKTVSPRAWLTLPPEVVPEGDEPLPASAVAEYCMEYVQKWNLQRYFRNDVLVSSVKVAPRSGEPCESPACIHNAAFQIYAYERRSGRVTRYLCARAALCAGAGDRRSVMPRPRRLARLAAHDLLQLHAAASALRPHSPANAPLTALIVGSGVSAADGVWLCAGTGGGGGTDGGRGNVRGWGEDAVGGKLKVLHLHRDPAPALKHPPAFQPHYSKIYKMMCEGPPPGEKYYVPYPEHVIVDVFIADEKPILNTTDTKLNEESRPKLVKLLNIVTNEIIEVKVAIIAILIGSKPDLFFLQTNFDMNTDNLDKKLCQKCTESEEKNKNDERQCFLKNHWHYLKSVVGQSLQSCTSRYMSQELEPTDSEREIIINNNQLNTKCLCHKNLITKFDNNYNKFVNEVSDKCKCRINLQKSRFSDNCKCSEENPYSSGLGFGLDPNKPVDGRTNPMAIDKSCHELLNAPKGIYALGPLTADNFIRFIPGGALAMVAHVHQTRKSSE